VSFLGLPSRIQGGEEPYLHEQDVGKNSSLSRAIGEILSKASAEEG
jgi:hypothetical protein